MYERSAFVCVQVQTYCG